MSTPIEQVLGLPFRFYVAVDDAETGDAELVRVKNENELSYNYEQADEPSTSKENGGEEVAAPGVERHTLRLNLEMNHGIADPGTMKVLSSRRQVVYGAITYQPEGQAQPSFFIEGRWLVQSIEMTASVGGVAKYAVSLKGSGVKTNLPFRAYSAS